MQGSAPVKYFVAILTNDVGLREHVVHVLGDHFGKADHESQWYPFSHTDYYHSEMGGGLMRSFVSFEKLLSPEDLAKVKQLTSKVEDRFRFKKNRKVNIDPGYVDYCKIVMASEKFSSYRVAISKGCYADFVMYYDKKGFIPLPWAFSDFASGTYNETLV